MCEIILVWVEVMAMIRADSQIKIFITIDSHSHSSTEAIEERSLNPQAVRAVTGQSRLQGR